MSLPDDDPYGWRTSFELEQSRPALSTADVWTHEEEAVSATRYQKVSLLGQGGMGRVWLGWDTQLRRSVAIKEPLGGVAEASRLMREARLCARLDHAGVVVIFDVYEDGDKPHFVMSLVRGQTLADLLLARTAEQSDLLRHVLAVCEAVGHAHRVGVLHRDLSPRNILIDQDHAARVIDWGLAIAVDEPQQGSPGTPGFMSPEQTRGETVDVRSDVWSLGALLFTVLTGHSPNIGPISPDVQPELRAIAEKAMAEDPEARYRDAAALGDDLRRWFEGRRIQAYDHTPWRIVRRMLLAYKGPILVALAVMAVVATSVVYGVVSTKREATRARLAEAEAQRSAAELLIQDAQAAARVGDTFRARRATSQSLQTRDSPQARGLWMYLSSAAKPTLVASQPLGECARWFILAVDDVVLCRASQTILQGWAGEKKIWELEQDNVELRADADRLYILDSQRTLLVVDVHTGAVVERDSRPGLFINPQGHERMTLVGDGWIHADWAMPNCAYGISESVFDAQTRWHLCKSGEVFKETDGRLEPVQIFSDVPNLMTVARDGALWGGTRHGTIRRVDATSRTLELGESLERIDVVPGSDLLLAVGRKSALRLFDPRTVQWVASYPDAAMVRATSSGVWLLREGRLEKWSVPSPTVWRYRSDHGMAFAAWSRDGARVAAVDGGGNYHEFWPHKGVALPPEQFTASVGKAVFPSATGEFFAVGTRSDGIWRMNTLDGKVLPTHAYDYLGSPRFAIFANGQAFSPSWAPGIRLLYLDRPVQNMQSVGSVFEVRMSADYETAVLFERETVWRWHQNEDPVRLDWSGPVLTGDFDGHHRIALISQGAIIVFGFDGKELQRFPAPKGATAIAWRKGHDELLVGRLDGGIVLLDLSGATIAEMTHHEGQISTLETSPDGAYLAAASWDATVSISALNYSPSAVSSTSF